MLAIPENINVVWKPIPGSSQEIAIDSRCHHTLYCGTRGPGKTITQLMRFRRYVGIGYGKHWRGVIFDVEHKNLDDLRAQSELFFYQFNDGARFSKSAQGYKWVWPTGEELLFRHVKSPDEYLKFHGHQYPFIGWNELTKYPTAELYNLMCSTNRSGFLSEEHTPKNADGTYATADGLPLASIPLEVFSTTNPDGIGHIWVKKRFIDCAEYGEIVEKKITILQGVGAETKEVEVTITQVAIFGSYRENIYLSPKYIADLNMAVANNRNKYLAWVMGSWDIASGGAIDDLWEKEIHVVPRFKIPENWYIDRSFDWGSTHPFSVCWWAESNGEEVELYDGRIFCPAKGSLIQIAEWYGTDEIGTNKGLRLSGKEIAEGIRDIEIDLLKEEWIEKQPYPGPADNQIFEDRRSNQDTIDKEMSDCGIKWERSNKSPGSRINGLQLFRDRLKAAIEKEKPAIYFMQNCKASIETLPNLPLDDKKIDDVDTEAEDHVYDAVRYRILKGNFRFATKFKTKIPT